MPYQLSFTGLVPWNLLQHNERPQRWLESRHPFVVWINIPTAGSILLTWLQNDDSLTWASNVSFGVLLFLFVSSAAYHHFAQSKLLRVIDQSAISAFVLAAVLPFVHHSPTATWTLFILFAANLWVKIADRESRTGSALLFLATGAVATFMYLGVGETVSGEKMTAPFMLSLGFFLSKLTVYALDLGRYIAPEHFGTHGVGHTLLLPGIGAFTYWVLTEAPV